MSAIRKEGKNMKCTNCGTEYQGNACPNCGAVSEIQNYSQQPNYQPQQPSQQPYYQQPQIVINNVNSNTNTNVNQNGGYGAGISSKSKMVTLILAIFLGYLGIHRFYVGKIGSGILYFFTGGLFCFGWIYDIIKVLSGTFRDGAGLPISK